MSKSLEEIADMLDEMDNSSPDLIMGFDMSTDNPGSTTHPCGSACCIGGWVQYLHPQLRDKTLVGAVMAVSNLDNSTAYHLCWDDRALYSGTSPQDGAQAIRNAVKFGDPKWDEILGPC